MNAILAVGLFRCSCGSLVFEISLVLSLVGRTKGFHVMELLKIRARGCACYQDILTYLLHTGLHCSIGKENTRMSKVSIYRDRRH